MPKGGELTRAQREFMENIARVVPRGARLRTARALERRGFVYRCGYFSNHSGRCRYWHLTDAGRKALSAPTGLGG